MNEDKKRLKQSYKLTKRPFGILQIRNTTNDRVLLLRAMDLQGMINRQKFALNSSGHPNRELQRDWNELGAQKFEFEILDQMEPGDQPGFDAKRELDFMEEMWLEKLQPFGERGYNDKKLSREERLRRIAENQRGS